MKAAKKRKVIAYDSELLLQGTHDRQSPHFQVDVIASATNQVAALRACTMKTCMQALQQYRVLPLCRFKLDLLLSLIADVNEDISFH